MSVFKKMSYDSLDDFVYGSSKKSVITRKGIVIGGGKIIPELNYTLPTMEIKEETLDKVYAQYRDMTEDALKRAVALHQDEYIIELEVLPPMTYNPLWGVEVVKIVRAIMDEFQENHGIVGSIRLTPVDIREDPKSPHMWSGEYWDKIMELFRLGANAGADLLSIESIGGKNVHDEASLYTDIKKSIFGLNVIGVRDMKRLWTEIVKIADETGTIAAGDTACGFANTAMVLAEMKYIPRVFSAVVRALSGIRSLVACEEGATGPHKDCGYEGVYVKAITGTPISMEGKCSAVAHFSSLGNIAAAVADLWSNESVQNVRLLSGFAPTVSMEQLIYDCRLMNEATKKDQNFMFRDLLIESDSYYDPQAYILRPDVAIELGKLMIGDDNYYIKSKKVGLKAINILREAHKNGKLLIDERELPYLDKYESDILELTDNEDEFIKEMLEDCSYIQKFTPHKYDM